MGLIDFKKLFHQVTQSKHGGTQRGFIAACFYYFELRSEEVEVGQC